ncbi:MAG TPA: hypothetical protein DCQ06_02950 [Myxococcales bacterium]|nr:hypothetical protein [Myxococcales bacterium]HAN30532.1 hypothetical protein [Myxococcales bacterium]
MSPTVQTLSQWAIWLAAVIATVGLLYLIRPRRRRVTVQFAGLWQKALARSEAQRFGGRWRRLLSLLLSLLISSTLMIAIGEDVLGLRSWTQAPKHDARFTLIVVDVSASMATLQDHQATKSPTRLQRAKSRIREMLQNAGVFDQFLVMSASGVVMTHCGWTNEIKTLADTLNTLQIRQGSVNIDRVERAAADALRGKTGAKMVWVSDGGHPAPRLSLPTKELRIGSHTIAPSDQGVFNLAVEHMTLRPNAGDPGRATLSIKIRNDSLIPMQARIVIYASDQAQSPAEFERTKSVQALHRLQVPAQSTEWLQLPNTALSNAHYAARVRPPATLAQHDVATWDDWGFVVNEQRRRLRIWRVGRPNLFLDAALLANEQLDVKRLNEVDLQSDFMQDKLNNQRGPDVVVFNQANRPYSLDVPSLTFDLSLRSDAKIVVAPDDLIINDSNHPVMRGVSLHDTNVDKVRVIDPRPQTRALVSIRGGGSVIVARSRAPREVELGLSLQETDIGGRYALPILLSNALDWLVGRSAWLPSSLVLGQRWSVRAPTDISGWIWKAPNQAPRSARRAGDHLIGVSEAHGIHIWLGPKGQRILRATRLPEVERPIVKYPALSLWTMNSTRPTRDQSTDRTPVWWWLSFAVVMGLIVEWGLYQRRRVA